ncbi:MAG: chromate transporter [Alistipes sp.]
MILLQLFISYLKIGFFGFGGGYAMLSLIQNEVVVQHAWMTNSEFADIVAISQITPGPIAINSATYVGYTVGSQAGGAGYGGAGYGVAGALIATFAVCLPALTIMLLVTRFFLRLHNNRLVEGAMRGMRPVVIGMIVAAALLLIFPYNATPAEANFIDGWSWALFSMVALGAWRKVNPILLIVLAATAGIAIYYLPQVV